MKIEINVCECSEAPQVVHTVPEQVCQICGTNPAQFGGWCAWCDAIDKGDVGELIEQVKVELRRHKRATRGK